MSAFNLGASLVLGFALGWLVAVVQRIDRRTAMLVRRQSIQLEAFDETRSMDRRERINSEIRQAERNGDARRLMDLLIEKRELDGSAGKN